MNEKEVLNLKELLKSNVVQVVFTKVNGEKRTMNCTLIESYLPQTDWGSKELHESQRDTALAVWSVDDGGWRSFRYESVLSYGLKEVLEEIN